MVDIGPSDWYAAEMSSPVESLVVALLEDGQRKTLADSPDERSSSLATLEFADRLRRGADRLCQEAAEAARGQGASWRQIGEAVGGITPQGAEHRFSPAAKERRSKASKVVWAEKERRAVPR
jgi:hypothetical protein